MEETRFETIFEDEIQEVRDSVELSDKQFKKLVKIVGALPELCDGVQFEDQDLIEIFRRSAESYDSYDMETFTNTGKDIHMVSLTQAVTNAVKNCMGENIEINFQK